VVPPEAQEPAPLPVQPAGSFGVWLMGTWSDPWPQEPPLARLPAAQQVISAKDREENNSQIVAAWREQNGSHATTLRRNELTKNFLRIIKTLRGVVAAWREKNK
jgi:hypothetical protein